MKWILISLALIIAACGTGVLVARQKGAWHADAPEYRTATVKRGDIVVTISATGTVEPEEVIDVGSQIAGQIISFGTDVNGKPIDYGSQVKAGMLLARIDDSLTQSDVSAAKALLAVAKAEVAGAQTNVDGAQAGVVKAQADLATKQAMLDQAGADWERAQKLGSSQALAETQYDAYKYAYEIAKANVALSQAAVTQSKAMVEQARAAVVQAEANVAQQQASVDKAVQNLSYFTINSPVDGVVIDRRVNIGQTVVSSLSSSSLFLLAKDLRKMQLWVAMNEADVGSIHPGQPVTFQVDAFPDEVFQAKVGKVRLNATMTQNVVTYTIEVETDNSSGRLLPYLTANAQFEVARHPNVLQVSNTALRWTPNVPQIAPEFRQGLPKESDKEADEESESSEPAGTQPAKKTPMGRGVLWVQDGEFLRPVAVRTGLTDGAMTEVTGRDLSEGLTVVTGVKTADADDANVTNPFAPQFGQAFRKRANTNKKDESTTGQGQSDKKSQGQGH